VAAGVACAPQPDAFGIGLGAVLEERDRAPPVGDLAPGIDIVARLAVAGAEPAVIVHEHDEPVVSERLREALEPHLLDARVAMGHGDRGVRPGAVGQVQPAAQHDAALGLELDIDALAHRAPSCTPS